MRAERLLTEYELLFPRGLLYTLSSACDKPQVIMCAFYQLICVKTMSLTVYLFRGEALTPINLGIPLLLPLNAFKYIVYI